MNVVSKLDAEKANTASQPEIILGDDWDERTRLEASETSQRKTRKRWISINHSPIARKIITFNLLALVVLMGGVLYLNQFRESLVDQRGQSLENQARLIAQVLEARAPETPDADLDAILTKDPTAVLDEIFLQSNVEVFVFDATENIVATSVGLARSPDEMIGAKDGGSGTIVTDFLNFIWEKLAAPFGSGVDRVVSLKELAQNAAAFGLAGQIHTYNVTDTSGDLLFSVATPIRHKDNVLGALVLTTVSGEINEMVRREREQVFQMFIIAILVSISLSLVLAGTIASPLRDLAEAAEAGRNPSARKLQPDRVRIPDMTARPDEIGRLSGALRDMIAALYDRIETNEQFAADVAHEIKNPLSSLRSATETLRIVQKVEQRDRLLDVIEHDVRRLDRLVSDISNASRLDSELVKEEMQSFDIIKMLENIAFSQKLEAEDKGAEFIDDLPTTPVIMHGLEERLAQVVVNLLTNAISFCQEGDAVRIWARQRDDRVLIVVEDTGPGIPEEALTKIFKRFYSERQGDDFGNHSGLGLAISRQIVEAHGGVIWAENIHPTDYDVTSEPLGARFVVGLPI